MTIKVTTPPIVRVTADVYPSVTLSGVITKDSLPIGRDIVIFSDSGCVVPVGATESSATDGSWSFVWTNAGPGDVYTVLVRAGTHDENNQIRTGIVA